MKNSKLNLFNALYLLIVFSIPLGQFGRYQFGQNIALYLHDIFALILVGFWFISLLISKRKPALPRLWPFLPIFLFAALSTIFINRLDLSVMVRSCLYLFRWFLLALIFPITHDLLRNKKLSVNTSSLLYFAGLLTAILGLLQYAFIPDTRFLYSFGWDDHYNRLIGTLFDPAYTGLILVFTLILAWERKSSIILQSLLLAALALTYSRASFLTFLFVLLARAVTIRPSRKDSIIIGIIFVVMVILLPTNLGEGTRLSRGYSVVSRAETSVSAVKLFAEKPLFGTGFYNFRTEENNKSIPSHSSAPDNSFALLLATTGVLGTAIYAIFLYKAAIMNRKSIPLFLTLIALTVHSFTNNTLFYPFVTIWFWLLLGYTSARTVNLETHNK